MEHSYVPVAYFGTPGHTSKTRDSPVHNGTSGHVKYNSKDDVIRNIKFNVAAAIDKTN